MFKRQETDLRRLLAMLLIPVCLMCAGCGGGGERIDGSGGRRRGNVAGAALLRLRIFQQDAKSQ